jgi:hypothetical protein
VQQQRRQRRYGTAQLYAHALLIVPLYASLAFTGWLAARLTAGTPRRLAVLPL